MAMAVVLIEDGDELVLTAAATVVLARMGVTDVTLVGGASITGVVVEGWAFDPSTATEAVTALLGRQASVRMLSPLAHTAIAAITPEGDQT
jgi:hypothetical protein